MSEDIKAKPGDSSILHYIKAVASSSDSVRTVIVVMVTTSVLVFVGFWNSKPSGGWLDQRIEVRRAALRFFHEPGQPEFEPATDLTPEALARYESAKKFIANSKFNTSSADDKDQLLAEILDLRKIRLEKIRLIQVPFFGTVFDMNDMGIFAGVAFTIVLLWFRYSLARQLRNLRLAFKEAEKSHQLKLCYDLLAMEQMLTVPPMPDQKRRYTWVLIAKGLFLVPLFLQLAHFRLNWLSRANGYLLSVKLMTVLLVCTGVSIVITSFLTWQCISLSIEGDHAWKDAARKIYPQAR